MSGQFQNPEETKVENETISEATPAKKIQNVADKAAEKSSDRTKRDDEDHSIISK